MVHDRHVLFFHYLLDVGEPTFCLRLVEGWESAWHLNATCWQQCEHCSQTWLAQADLFQIRSKNSFCNVLGLIPECQDVQNPWLIECAKSLIIPKRNCDLRKATFWTAPRLFGHCPNTIRTPLQSNMHCGAFLARRDVFFYNRAQNHVGTETENVQIDGRSAC